MIRITTLLIFLLAFQLSHADQEKKTTCAPPHSCGSAPPTCKEDEQVNCTLGIEMGRGTCLKLFSCELVGKTCTLTKATKADACLTCRDNCLKAKWEGDTNSWDNWKDCFKACARRQKFDSHPY